jgi:hypothetical protein
VYVYVDARCAAPRLTHLVRTTAKDNVVLGLALRERLGTLGGGQPPLGLEAVGLGVDGLVVQRVPEGRDDHRVLWHGVFGGDREGLGGEVRNLSGLAGTDEHESESVQMGRPCEEDSPTSARFVRFK